MAITGKLLGDPFANTALFVEQDNRSDAFLFDCGCLQPLTDKELLRVSALFISHAHIDHFIDFDRWLAAWIRRSRTEPGPTTISCYGPAGFNRNIEGRLMGFLWNLVDFDLTIISHEIDIEAISIARFHSRDQFCRSSHSPEMTPLKSNRKTPEAIQIYRDQRIDVSCILLDHNTPSLAYRIAETAVAVIDKTALRKLELPEGPWLGKFKEAVAAGEPDDTAIDTPAGPAALGRLRKQLLHMKPGQSIAFVTDTIYNKKTAPAIETIAEKADTLFIEATFLHADLAQARETCHLTARQAGRVAAAAGAVNIVPFHFSPRYRDREKLILKELTDATARR
jgi:ribonuclease Z